MGSNCVITNGLALTSCVNNIPGLEALWVLTTTGTTAEITGITYNTGGEITGLTANAGTEFKKIDVVRNSSAALLVSTTTHNLSSPSLDFSKMERTCISKSFRTLNHTSS
jgi:hypothetical protein